MRRLPSSRGSGRDASAAPARAGSSEPARETSGSHAGREAEQVSKREAHRGRQARTPSEIPAAGWKDIGLRVFHDVSENRLVSVAAGVTFYVLLAIFPAVAALVSLYGLFTDPSTINDHLSLLQGVLPSGAPAVKVCGNGVFLRTLAVFPIPCSIFP